MSSITASCFLFSGVLGEETLLNDVAFISKCCCSRFNRKSNNTASEMFVYFFVSFHTAEMHFF